MRDMDLRKNYPNVNKFEDLAIHKSWNAKTLHSPNEIVYEFFEKKELYEVTIKKIEAKD